ncbi:MAG: histidine triad nucleotide-binding protein [Alphaproteobacteria bacterium]
MSYNTDNIFAKIIRGEIPCDKIYEDDHVMAFHDKFPQAPIHALVIPKGSYISADDFGANASAEEITALYRAVSHIARDLGVAEDGYRLIANHRKNAGQEVDHYHVHILGGKPLGPMLRQ